ncbi:MAG: hypothetical protein WC011_01635 [Candidatus Paceibacterota bacterium]
MKFFKKQKLNTAFTLVETLVAISIFTGAILSLLSFSGGSVGDTNYSKNKLVATFLAQEGLEYMKNIRDTHVLFESDGWTAFRLKVAPCETGNGCYFDPNTVNYTSSAQPMKFITITECPAGVCPKLRYDNSENIAITRYNYNPSSTETNFIRKIEVRNLTNAANTIGENKEIIVVSTVYWTKGTQNYNVSFSNYLKNWAE